MLKHKETPVVLEDYMHKFRTRTQKTNKGNFSFFENVIIGELNS